jgi:anaerobic magnesium-protoporphyrin IX monomethyl ester cyclase
MRILFISPFRGRTYESVGIHVPPLGILYVAAVLQRQGHEIDVNISESPEVQENLDFDYCDAVGISSTTPQFPAALRVARHAHAAGKPVVMGGPHPTTSAEEVLRTGVVDFVVRGEGEVTATELFEVLSHTNPAPSDLCKILGLSWIDRENGRIVHNPPRPFMTDLDRLPLPARELAGNDYVVQSRDTDGRISPTMITTRGCPFGCKFCDVQVLAGKRFRIRDPRSCVDELESLATEYNATSFRLVDDIINFSARRMHALFDIILERGLKLNLWVMGRADMLLRHPRTVEKMAKAGVSLMFLGIESPHKRILQSYRKGGKVSADTSAQAVQLLREHGIGAFGGFMLGEVSETEAEIRETIEYACQIDPSTAQFSILTPYPGTETWEELKDRLVVDNWEWFDGLHAVFDGEHLKAQELESLLRKAYLKFYLRPGRIVKQLRASARNHGRNLAGPRIKTVASIFKLLREVYPKDREFIQPTNGSWVEESPVREVASL